MAYKDHNIALEYWRQYNAKRRAHLQKHARKVAKEQGLTHYFTNKPCKHGHIAQRRVSDRVCMECQRQEKIIFRAVNPEKKRLIAKQSYERNKESSLAQKKQYRQSNKGKIAALNAARKRIVKQRTPSWLTPVDFERIQNEYKLAALMTKLTGEAWHVDHVVPLQGKLVSGLHVPGNLKAIRGVKILSKRIDMR